MHIDAGWLFASMAVSAIGYVLLHYGRKQSRVPHVLAGVALLIYPYFVPGVVLTLVIAAAVLGVLALAVRLGW